MSICTIILPIQVPLSSYFYFLYSPIKLSTFWTEFLLRDFSRTKSIQPSPSQWTVNHIHNRFYAAKHWERQQPSSAGVFPLWCQRVESSVSITSFHFFLSMKEEFAVSTFRCDSLQMSYFESMYLVHTTTINEYM